MSQILTVEVPSFSLRYGGDAMRRAAFTRALGAGETGVCLVLVKREDYDPIQVVVHVPTKEASIVLPVPKGPAQRKRSAAPGSGGVSAIGRDHRNAQSRECLHHCRRLQRGSAGRHMTVNGGRCGC